MPYCSNCGNAIHPNAKFCSECGSAISLNATPVVQSAPVANTASVVTPAPTYAVPAVVAKPVVSSGTKVKGFVGMGLSVGGLVFAAIGLLATLATIENGQASFFMSTYFGIFSWPLSIVGRILCGQSILAGNRSGACSTGSKLSIAAMIVSAVMLFLGFVSLMAA